MSSKDRLSEPGSADRWKLWLITVHPRSRTAQLKAARSFEFAECSLHSGACPCGLFDSLFLMIACTFSEWSDGDGVVSYRASITRLVVLVGPSSQTATFTPAPLGPAVWTSSEFAIAIESLRSSIPSGSYRKTPATSSRLASCWIERFF